MSHHSVRGGPAATFQSVGFAEKVQRQAARWLATRHIQRTAKRQDWDPQDLALVLESLGLPEDIMTEEQTPMDPNDREVALAAAELIRAQDSARELGAARRNNEIAGRRVGAANDRLTVAKDRRDKRKKEKSS